LRLTLCAAPIPAGASQDKDGHIVEGEVSKLTPVGRNEDAGANRMFAALYDDLHRVAVHQLRCNSGVTLSPTTLLHETFLNSSVREFAQLSDRGRFMVYASRAMRGLIIDYLRRGTSKKRGGEFKFISLPEELQHAVQNGIGVEELREALDSLESMDPRLAECVDLKFFCGFSFAAIAQLWGVSERTVHRDWEKARVLLNRLIEGLQSIPGSPPERVLR
jgi:RNA polymerase sigma factor (TIGR02999 family)